MEFRYLGTSGFKISEITFGNWLTHGSQVENDVATQCVRAALEAGIGTFDTADVYANTAAENAMDMLWSQVPLRIHQSFPAITDGAVWFYVHHSDLGNAMAPRKESCRFHIDDGESCVHGLVPQLRQLRFSG